MSDIIHKASLTSLCGDCTPQRGRNSNVPNVDRFINRSLISNLSMRRGQATLHLVQLALDTRPDRQTDGHTESGFEKFGIHVARIASFPGSKLSDRINNIFIDI